MNETGGEPLFAPSLKQNLIFWIQWTLVSIAAATLTGVLSLETFWSFGLALGILLGPAQWIVLRRHQPTSALWIFGTVIGAALGQIAAIVLWELSGLVGDRGTGTMFVVVGCMATSFGVGQWLAIRRAGKLTAFWAPICGLAWASGAALAFNRVPEGLWWVSDFALMGAFAGQVTGVVALSLILHYARQQFNWKRAAAYTAVLVALVGVNLLAATLYGQWRAGTVRKTRQAERAAYFEELGWQPMHIEEGGNYSSIFFIDDRQGWIAGSAGLILATADGGDTWRQQSTGVAVDLHSLAFVNERSGWAVGDDGLILHTDNGGQTWAMQSNPSRRDLYAVFFLDESTGWAVGGGGMYGPDPEFLTDNQVILRTNDAGETWQRQDSASHNILKDVHFTNADAGWAVGVEGTAIATTDGGREWIEQQSYTTEDLTAVYFVDQDNGWAVGSSFSTGSLANIQRTVDGGRKWLPYRGGLRSGLLLTDLHFFDERNGFAVGQNQYYETAGFVPMRTASAVLLSTEDGGESWALKSMPGLSLSAVHFLDPDTGWVVGENGEALKTND